MAIVLQTKMYEMFRAARDSDSLVEIVKGSNNQIVHPVPRSIPNATHGETEAPAADDPRDTGITGAEYPRPCEGAVGRGTPEVGAGAHIVEVAVDAADAARQRRKTRTIGAIPGFGL